MMYQDYYSTPGVKKICHDIKQSDDLVLQNNSINIVVDYFTKKYRLDETCYIIPAPQHNGYAEYTKRICEIVSSKTNAKILDIVKCKPHKSIYEQKYEGKLNNSLVAEFYLTGPIPKRGRLFFVDNVISSGETFKRIDDLFSGGLIPMVYAVDFSRLKNESVLKKLLYYEEKGEKFNKQKGENVMAVTKDWLDRTGTKICVEDIYQMQLMYETPDSSHGPLVGTRSLYMSNKGSLYQCIEYDDKEKTNERYPAGIELSLNTSEVEQLKSGDRTNPNYQSCLSELQKATIWDFFRQGEQFKTVHKETNKVSDYSEITIKFGKGCMKEFERPVENGEPEKFAEIRFKDSGTWKTFVVPRKYVHENKYGSGLWMKRNAAGRTKVTTYNPETKERTEEWIGNKDLKSKVESYKQKKKMR